MSTQVGMTIIKKFTYRGDSAEEYSNTYWLSGTVPADTTAWRALFDALVLQEKTLYPPSVTVVRGYGYNDNTGHKTGDTGDVAPAVYSVDLTVAPNSPVAGTLSPSSNNQAPGDSAVWVRWKTGRLNTKGKAIYLRKYFHPAFMAGTTGGDAIDVMQGVKLTAFGTKMRDGTFLDARVVQAPGHTDAPVASGSSAYVTTRTLHRRGKRPNS